MKPLNDALIALDMVHADVWLKLNMIREAGTDEIVVKEVELACILALIQAAMNDCGEKRKFGPYPGTPSKGGPDADKSANSHIQ